MDRGWYARLFLVLAVCLGGAYLVYPSYYYFTKATAEERDDNTKFCDAMPPGMYCSRFNLGLDLQGGVHLVMGVRVEKAVESRLDRLAEEMRDTTDEKAPKLADISRARDSTVINVKLAEGTSPEAFTKYLRTDFEILQIQSEKDGVFALELTDAETKYVQDMAVEQAIKTIRNRADRLGVTEPTIARRGTNNVLIQLPGVKDPERAIDLIGRTAQLAFTIIEEDATQVFANIPEDSLPKDVVRRTDSQEGADGQSLSEIYFELPEGREIEVRALLENQLPDNRRLAFGVLRGEGQEKILRTYVLNSSPGITGDYLTQARVSQDSEVPSEYFVSMTFDTKGARIFEKLTESNVKRRMAIVLDGKVNSAPVIQERIGGGTARITLGGSIDPQASFQEAKDLTLVLKAGALPAPVEIQEKRQVGKSLGQDSVKQGTWAIAIGFILVVVFMLAYYKMSGLFANVALVLNVLLVLGALALFDATLTLPGMAGIVLIIGMAVDANVIIFERIREELRDGRSARIAVDAGYSKAWSTIVDSNVTTLIAGVVLMQYGSGPVRGFAVTLIIGILCSMFTAIVVTRLIFDFYVKRLNQKPLSI